MSNIAQQCQDAEWCQGVGNQKDCQDGEYHLGVKHCMATPDRQSAVRMLSTARVGEIVRDASMTSKCLLVRVPRQQQVAGHCKRCQDIK